MDGGAWWATVHGVAKSRTQLSDFTHTHIRPNDDPFQEDLFQLAATSRNAAASEEWRNSFRRNKKIGPKQK